MNKLTVAVLSFFVILSVFLHLHKSNSVPACLNADEVSYAYNALSIVQTGRDEHGEFLPLRLRSFDDFKLPAYAYLSIPFIKIFDSDFSIRLLNILVGVLFVPLIYLLAKEIFEKDKVSLLAAFFTSSTLWIFILTRHAHEGALAALLVLAGTYFFVKWQRNPTIWLFLLLNGSLLLSTFAYHTGRIFIIFFVICQLYEILFSKKRIVNLQKKLLLTFVVLAFLMVPFIVDHSYGASRVQNLLFFHREGFQMRLDQYLGEHPERAIHNKGTEAVRELTSRYFSQLSTDFLVRDGDKNPRFGYENMAPMTPIFFATFLIGLYFLFRDSHPRRYLLLLLFLISPLGNALTFQEASITRVYFMIFPMMLIASYGVIRFLDEVSNKNLRTILIIMLILLHTLFLYFSWDVYFNHYFKRAYVDRAWQCGYRELFADIKPDLDGFDHVYITERYGQPYIFALYYLGIDPTSYQNKAIISPPDQYGFSQVKSYDKFVFDFMPEKLTQKKSLFIGFPDEFAGTGIDEHKIRKIKYGNEEIFWVYENK